MSKFGNFKSEDEWNAEHKREVQLFAFKDIVTPTCIGLQSANVNLSRVCDKTYFYASHRFSSSQNAA